MERKRRSGAQYAELNVASAVVIDVDNAIEADLRSTKKMRAALADDVSENQQSDNREK
jgi:hypothetical protein